MFSADQCKIVNHLRMKKLVVAVFLCVFMFSVLKAQIAQFGGLNRNGIYDETNLLEEWPLDGPELLATVSGIGDGYGSPAINENGIYIAGTMDSITSIFHFDHNYKLKWKTPVGREFTYKFVGSRGTPTVEGNRLYYVAAFGDAVCLDASTGEKIWHINIQQKFDGPEIKWGYAESPLIYKEKIFFTAGGPKNNFVALNKSNGEKIWSLDLEGAVNAYCSPVIVNHKGKDLILLNTSNAIVLMDPNDGSVLVKHTLNESHYNHAIPPIYVDDKLFYSSGYGEGSVLFQIQEVQQQLDTLYTNADLDCKLSGMILYDGIVFGTSDNRKQWVGVDFESGETVFSSRAFKPGSFIQADNKFYLYSDSGEVALAHPSKNGFEIVSRFQIPEGKAIYAFSIPVISNGILFIRYNNDLWLYKIN
jgi:outer membrane protein assembly factor BamB